MSRKRKMLLKDLLVAYIDARNNERPINATLAVKTRESFEEVVRVFTKYLGRAATVDDLNPESRARRAVGRCSGGAN
jgi:hypothetical protein